MWPHDDYEERLLAQKEKVDMSKNTNTLFERALRAKTRFPSPRGSLTLEQLWDVPLRSARDDFNLNTIAQAVDADLQKSTKKDFVDGGANPEATNVKLAFEIVEHVIETKKDEEAAAKTRADNKQEREKLLKILAEKQEGKLSDLSEKELQRRIAALSE